MLHLQADMSREDVLLHYKTLMANQLATKANPYFKLLNIEEKGNKAGCKRKRHMKSLGKQKMLYTVL